MEDRTVPNHHSSLVRRSAAFVAVTAIIALVTASSALGALINGTLPTVGFTYASVADHSVTIAGSGITLAHIARLQRLIKGLSAVSNPTAAQRASLASYEALLDNYQARYDAAIDLRLPDSANVKTTFSRVAPNVTFESGWHYHNGPVIVTVTTGTLTLIDSKCATSDLSAGHTYVESPKQVLNARALPARNAGVENVEWFTTRIYPSGAIDPVPVPAPCTP
jgi:hypothetical protein